jgi:hypothetical protein
VSGWTRRRSSGEIINATLLEVFLALLFVIFGLAVFVQQKGDAATAALEGALSREAADGMRSSLSALRDSLASARNAARLRSDSLTAVQKRVASLLYESPHPPDCEPRADPPWLMTVTLTGPGQLTVLGHRPVGGLTPGAVFTTSYAGFKERFRELDAAARQRGCRYYVQVRDTPNTPKTEYKAAMQAITSIFRFRGAFQ